MVSDERTGDGPAAPEKTMIVFSEHATFQESIMTTKDKAKEYQAAIGEWESAQAAQREELHTLRENMFEIQQLLKQPLSQEDRTELEKTLFEYMQAHKQGEERLEELQVGIADLKRQSAHLVQANLVTVQANLVTVVGKVAAVLVGLWFLFDIFDDLPEMLIELGLLLRRTGW